ncbi:hypothetical protein F4824DRAFT_445578 [Ustulina deusta]|nr:hypothetical protein F4823DRAFT_253069 [Ustulina deusta]KAI3342265.1 hypothetical protein F4824DRAFT_445578 [Ustulina deusta]
MRKRSIHSPLQTPITTRTIIHTIFEYHTSDCSSPQSTIKMTHASMDQKTKKVEEARSNLPLPEQPPVASDWNSADARNVNVGSGSLQSDISTGAGSTSGLREPASKADVDLSRVGRQGKDNLEGPPEDAKA